MHGGDIWKYLKQPSEKDVALNVIDFSANINPLGPPDHVREVLARALDQVMFYPEPQARTLRAELAACYGVDPQEVIVGNGAAELIFLYCRARGGPRAVLPAPTFSEYALACRAAGGRTYNFPLAESDDFYLSPGAFLACLNQVGQPPLPGIAANRPIVVFLCQPNNPTGQLLPRHALQKLVTDLHTAGAGVFLDLSFLGFVPGQCLENGTLPAVPLDAFKELIKCSSAAESVANRPSGDLFFLSSFTKLFALPGLRLGFGLGPRELIAAMERQRDPWSVNILAQRAGQQCLQEKEYVEKSIKLLSVAREELAKGLAKIGGIRVFPGTANFLLCHLRERGLHASALVTHLAKSGLLVRSAANFPGLDPYYFRLAVRLPAENARLLQEIELFLNGKGCG